MDRPFPDQSQHLPTPPKCSMRAIVALINNLGIVYHQYCSSSQEPISTQTATKRVIKILDAKYDKADLPAIVNASCSHLTPLQQEKLLSLLLKYESLFDTLGDWNRPPISIELKEGVKPYHGRPYPIPLLDIDTPIICFLIVVFLITAYQC